MPSIGSVATQPSTLIQRRWCSHMSFRSARRGAGVFQPSRSRRQSVGFTESKHLYVSKLCAQGRWRGCRRWAAGGAGAGGGGGGPPGTWG
eukprot:9889720-Alexandrium_andersonii.AAC.1